MKRVISIFLSLFSVSAFSQPDMRNIDLTLSFYWATDTCEITTLNSELILDKAALKPLSSGNMYYSKVLHPTIAQKQGDRFVTNCTESFSNKWIQGDFLLCSSRESSIRKFHARLDVQADFINEFCYSEPINGGYYFEYRIETDSKQIAMDAAENGRCRFTCLVK